MLVLERPNKMVTNAIYEDVGTTYEAVRNDAQTLMQWLRKQPHLPNVKDEDFIVHFILRCKNSMEKAKIFLERYYTLRDFMPEVYDNRDPISFNMELSTDGIAFVPLPKLTPDGYRVSILRFFNPALCETLDPLDAIKIIFMGADLRMKIDLMRGDVFVFDLHNFNMSITAMVMSNLRKFITPGTKGLPTRIKNIYIINASAATDSLIAFAKTFLKKGLVQKIEMLKKREELMNLLPKDMLPKDYGGYEPSLFELKKDWVNTLKNYRNWFLLEHSVKADNSKKLVRGNSELIDIPLEGSFRKISID